MVDKTLYVSIDIGKNVHWFAGFSGIPLELIEPEQKVRNNLVGYELFKAWLNQQLACYDKVVVAHEPTGIYHQNFSYATIKMTPLCAILMAESTTISSMRMPSSSAVSLLDYFLSDSRGNLSFGPLNQLSDKDTATSLSL